MAYQMWLVRASRCLAIVGPIVLAGIFSITAYRIHVAPVMVSYNGETYRFEIFNAVNQGARGINISNAYLCVREGRVASLPPELQRLGREDAENECTSAQGGDKLYVPLPDRISVSLVDHSNIRISLAKVSEKQANVVIESMRPLADDASYCGPLDEHLARVTPYGRAFKPFDLPLGVELHAPPRTDLIIPFEGEIKIGSHPSGDQASILARGMLSVFGSSDQSLVRIRDFDLYPGDVVRFGDADDCGVRSKGFARVTEDAGTPLFDLVASAMTPGAIATVQRDRPDPGQTKITVGMDFLDAFLSHPGFNWLAGSITAFVILKEALGLALVNSGSAVNEGNNRSLPLKNPLSPKRKWRSLLSSRRSSK